MSNETIVKAHVVPRTYLKGFADSRRGIGVYNSEVGKPAYIEKNVRDVASQFDFYTLYRADGTADNALEDAFSRLESDLRDTLKLVRSDKQLGDPEYDRLALFAAMQEVRSERNRHAMTSPLQQLEAEVRKRLRNDGVKDEAIQEAIDASYSGNFVSGDLRLAPSNISLLMIPEGLRIRYKFFRTMSKCLVKSVAHDFFTSDHPVVWTETSRPPKPIGFDFLSISAEVTYPLTKRYCLVMSYFPLLPRFDAPAELVTMINARTARGALREVYAPPKSPAREADRFVQDIAAVARPVLPLFPMLMDKPSKGNVPDIGSLADALGIERDCITEINRPFIRFFGRAPTAVSSPRSKG